jgi:enolase
MTTVAGKVRQYLHSDHVIANHILVSFHAAFMSSLLNIPQELYGTQVLQFVFVSYETLVSAVFWFFTFHTGIALHEMGHYLSAVRVNALKDDLLPDARECMSASFVPRLFWYVRMFLLIPYGAFRGVKREGFTYYPEAPFNLAVAAAGPRASRILAGIMLPAAFALLIIGLTGNIDGIIYIGRLCLGLGAVGLIDFLLADPGKLVDYNEREKQARRQAQKVTRDEDTRLSDIAAVKKMMRTRRVQEVALHDHETLQAPWQFRNCGMGGRHTEKEYPESNISMQEMMFIPLCAGDYEEAQMVTVTLQNRLKEIIENAPGARVMGIGLEGGLAPYISREPGDSIPEQRMWRMAVQAIKDCGYIPGRDIVLAFDPALSELSNAYRKEFKQSDCVGMYLFWRAEEKVVMTREQLVDLYKKTVSEIPIVSIEDGLAEDDHEGWRMLMQELGDRVFIIGDDLVTTNDATIETCADNGLMNTALIKANQIGTLSETMLAMLDALGKGLDLVVSHRSKSPNDDMEAQIALAVNAVGLKTGGGANTERLFKYGAVTKIMKDMARNTEVHESAAGTVKNMLADLVITDMIAYEEPTNAGIPTVGVEVHVGAGQRGTYRKLFSFTGATPLGTSAGVGEAIHLIDSILESSAMIREHITLFDEQADKTFRFKKSVTEQDVVQTGDEDLRKLWIRAQRYSGKGCQNAVANVVGVIAPRFVGKKVGQFTSIHDVDRILLTLELQTARDRQKLNTTGTEQEFIEIIQRKGNLGMNAILSVSLALGRMIAHLEGKGLWQLLRTEMKRTMAQMILVHAPEAVADMLGPDVRKKISSSAQHSWQLLVEQLTFEQLVTALQVVNVRLGERGTPLYHALRQQMPVYDTDA